MELLWMILPVFLVCAEAENVTEVKVELGHNVTLNCSVERSDTYWYMEIHNQFRVAILRTFNNADNDPSYCRPEFKTKYSVLGNRLVITNITAEDCRRYFCAQKKNNIFHFGDPINLVSDVPITPSNNDSNPNNNQQHTQRRWSEPVIFSLFALNGLFLLFFIGSCFTSLNRKRKSSKFQMNEPSPLTPENPGTLETPQYEEIQLRVPQPTARPDDIYYKVQLPHSTLPEHLDIT